LLLVQASGTAEVARLSLSFLAIRLLEFSPIQVFCYRPRARIAAGEAILLKAGRSSL